MSDIIIENARFRLTLGSDCIAKSLVHKETCEECLLSGAQMPLFSVTQERPFNNESKQVLSPACMFCSLRPSFA